MYSENEDTSLGGGEWQGEREETKPISALRGLALALPLCEVITEY